MDFFGSAWALFFVQSLAKSILDLKVDRMLTVPSIS